MIELSDRISDVLARDPDLVDVFISVSPAFTKLRRRALARVMTRLVTVEQAARIAKVSPRLLLSRLNEALGFEATKDAVDADAPAEPLPPLPDAVRALAPDRVVDLDVREDIRDGREPFGAISAAVSRLPEGHALRVRAPFEPVPLYDALLKRGLRHHTERLGDEDWRVWFVGGEPPAPQPVAERGELPPRSPVCDSDGCVTIDVRGLEPPEPMIRTLQALDALPVGVTLVQINQRVPRFLLPKLDDRGFEYEAHAADDGTVRLHIRHRRKDVASGGD